MKQESYISSRQLFAMLIVFQLVIMMTADTVLLGGENLADNILSCGIGFAVNFVLILPLYFLNRRGPGTNILEKSYDLFGSFGAAVALFYVIYFIFWIATICHFSICLRSMCWIPKFRRG